MEKYKPKYMGQVIEADDASKLTDFVSNKYDSFSKCYDSVKDESDNINSVSAGSNKEGSTEFSMKINTDSDTMEKISEKVSDDESVSVVGNIVTAK